MKLFVNIARLEIDQLFTQGMRQGHLCTLDTFLVLNSFLDTKWFQAMKKDCMVDNIFLGALFYPGSSSSTYFY